MINGKRGGLVLLFVSLVVCVLITGYTKVSAKPFAPTMLNAPPQAGNPPLPPMSIQKQVHRKSVAAIPSDVDADPVIAAILNDVTPLALNQHDGSLSGEWPVTVGGQPYTINTRYTYSGTPIQKATQYVGEQFASLGLSVEYHEWSGSSYPNVIAELPGQTFPNQIYLICAHLDSTSGAPQSSAPGADDNASGSSGVLLAAELLSSYEWDYTLRFALWTGEEQGLLGSDVYAARAATNGEQILGVLNMDMIAYNSDLAPIIDLHARSWLPDSVNMANLFADVVAEYALPLQPDVLINNWLGDYSDNRSFWDENYAAILVIEDYDDFTPYYHTTNDKLATLNLAYFAAATKASLGTFAHMSGAPWRGYATGSVTAVSDGNPVPGAAVRFAHPQRSTLMTVTDAGGVYTTTLATGTYTMSVLAPGYLPWTQAGVVLDKDTTTVQDAALDASSSDGSVAGTVTNLYCGCPIGGAEISLEHSSLLTVTAVVTSNVSGYFTTSLPSGTYLMTVNAEGFQTAVFYNIPVIAGTTTTQDVALEPRPGSVQGTITAVVTPTIPVTDAMITLVAPGLAFTTTSDAAGYYTLTVPARTYTMTVFAPGYLSQTVQGIVVASNVALTWDVALEPVGALPYILYLPAIR